MLHNQPITVSRFCFKWCKASRLVYNQSSFQCFLLILTNPYLDLCFQIGCLQYASCLPSPGLNRKKKGFLFYISHKNMFYICVFHFLHYICLSHFFFSLHFYRSDITHTVSAHLVMKSRIKQLYIHLLCASKLSTALYLANIYFYLHAFYYLECVYLHNKPQDRTIQLV